MLSLFILVVMSSSQEVFGNFDYETYLLQTISTLSAPCRKLITPESLNQRWFWKMVDASSELPSGILGGNMMPLGDYDGCMAIDEIGAKFCKGSNSRLVKPLAGFFLNLSSFDTDIEIYSIRINHGFFFCVPRACSSQDMNVLTFNQLNFDDKHCKTNDAEMIVDSFFITAVMFFVMIILIAMIATIRDLYGKSRSPLVLSFSLYSNFCELSCDSTPEFSVLNGIKAISTMWIVLAHTLLSYSFIPLSNPVATYYDLQSFWITFIRSAAFAVDTFLVITGFLTIYGFQFMMDKGVKFNLFMYYAYRYLRITPAFVAMVLFHGAFISYLGDGALWSGAEDLFVQPCKKHWWSALLFIQNYAHHQTCIPESWYLAVDMQIVILSPLLLFLMRNEPRLGYAVISCVGAMSITVGCMVGWSLPARSFDEIMFSPRMGTYMKKYYEATHARIAPYLFGILLGYKIYNVRKEPKKLSLNKYWVSLGWSLSVTLLICCCVAEKILSSLENRNVAASVYVGLTKPLWALAICWIIFASTTGYGRPFDRFCSLPFFQVLGRMSYSMFLVHYPIVFLRRFTIRSAPYLTQYTIWHEFIGNFVLSFIAAVVWTLLFESPGIVLSKSLVAAKFTNIANKKDK